jgi:replicative DNA helicase
MSHLPSNIDAERGILSACLQWPQTCDEVSVLGGSALFYHPAHRTVWNALEAMRAERLEIGLATVIARFRESDKLEAVGGPQALAELFDDVASRALLPDLLKFASDAAKRRSLFVLAESAIRDAKDPAKRVDDTMQRMDTGIRAVLTQTSSDGLKPYARVLSDFLDLTNERYFSDQKGAGISTGFGILDEMTGGLQPGQLWVIGARPGAGKTAYAYQIAENVARAGSSVAFFSAEMLAVELVTRAIAADSKIDSLKIQNGYLKKQDFPRLTESIQRRMKDPIFIDDRPNMRLIDIQVGARRAVSEHGIKVAFVDYLQLIQEEEGSRNREDAVRRLSNGLKQLAKELGITVVALAQLNRQSDGKDAKPRASNLRDSGSIEQDANTIVLLHSESKTSATAIVAKVRGGKRGEIALDFDGPTTRFFESQNQREDVE